MEMKQVCAYYNYPNYYVDAENIDADDRAIDEVMRVHSDWRLYDKFRDISTQRTYDRPGLEKLMEQAKIGNIDILLIPKLSMLGRNTLDVMRTVRRLNGYGCSVFFIKENMLLNPDSNPELNSLFDTLQSVGERIANSFDKCQSATDPYEFLDYLDRLIGTEDEPETINIQVGNMVLSLPFDEELAEYLIDYVERAGCILDNQEQSM